MCVDITAQYTTIHILPISTTNYPYLYTHEWNDHQKDTHILSVHQFFTNSQL